MYEAFGEISEVMMYSLVLITKSHLSVFFPSFVVTIIAVGRQKDISGF